MRVITRLEPVVEQFSCDVLFRPANDELTYLPEGPQHCGDTEVSWVAIQHGTESSIGSLNLLDLATTNNRTFNLSGRPGFAFPASRAGEFLIGQEREVGLFSTQTGQWTRLLDGVDADVKETIINDGVLFEEGLIFGTKDLRFSEHKAGLYLWRKDDRRLIRLRADQICSNGKVVFDDERGFRLLDIDSPTKTVVEYELDVAAGKLGEPKIVVDLRDGDVFPDGMVLTPDGQGVIIAIYNPHDATCGEARQYHLDSGQLQAIWRTDLSPRVTCPLLMKSEGQVKLVLTTAVEHMPGLLREGCPNAGCMFIGDTSFQDLPAQPTFEL